MIVTVLERVCVDNTEHADCIGIVAILLPSLPIATSPESTNGESPAICKTNLL